MAERKNKILYTVTMLLILAASFALHPNITFAAKEMPDEDCISVLTAAAGLPNKKAKWTGVKASEGVDATETPALASYAASLLRYQSGYLSTLPNVAGTLPVPTVLQAEEAANRLLTEKTIFDMEPYIVQLKGKRTQQYRVLAANAEVFRQMSERVRVCTERAVTVCVPAVRRDLTAMGKIMPIPPAPYNLPDWKRLAALYAVYGADTPELLRRTLQAEIVSTGADSATLEIRYGTFDEVASQGNRKQFIQARFTLAYLNTAFDEQGLDTVPQKRVYDAAYLATLIHPVPGYLIKDGWFDPRDSGTRHHTGTDIRAPGGTKIHSATDGEVLYIGYLPIPGYYVIIRDPYGYEYHYYHMRERTGFVKEGDVVKQGDVIGRVGNTGNSAANHLHLTVVSPENAYVNPYDLLLQAGMTPIKLKP